MDESERNFHDSLKPSWGPGSILLYSKPSQLTQQNNKPKRASSALVKERDTLSSDGREIAMAKVATSAADVSKVSLTYY